MKRSMSAAGLTSLLMALVCFAGAIALFQGDAGRGQDRLFISEISESAR